MEVLANGMISKFWIPVEDEPDIDRFIDDDIMVDMDTFTIQGILKKVSTCKKKNEDKEYEYFKELTIQVVGIINAEDPGQNIRIPDKKDEYAYHVEFRYVPAGDEPEEVPADQEESADEALAVAEAGLGAPEEKDFFPDEADIYQDSDPEEVAANDGNPEPDASDDPDNPEPEGSVEPDDFFDDVATSDADPAAEKKPDDDGIDWD